MTLDDRAHEDEHRLGVGTRKLRNYTLYAYYTLCFVCPPALIVRIGEDMVFSAGTWAFFAAHCVLVFSVAVSLHYFTAQVLEARPAPRWISVLLGASTFINAVLAIVTLPTDRFLSSPLWWGLIATASWLLVALGPFLDMRSAILLPFATSLVTGVIHGISVALTLGDIRLACIIAALSTALTFFLLLFLTSTMLWSYKVLWAVGAQERVDALQANLAVADERLRIARDLHDVFGRTLTAVAVKSELAAALADAEDAPQAAREARRVKGLAEDALREVRLVLAEYRRPNVTTELAGATAFLMSAGVSTRVIGDRNVPEWASEPLALVLREAATNVVRHSEAKTCVITVRVSEDGAHVEVRNDRAHAPSPPLSASNEGEAASSGLESLSARIAACGGTLHLSRSGEIFTLSAHVPRPA